jgi:hypothetical protein
MMAVDALQMRWYRYVISYTLEDQARPPCRFAAERLWQASRANGEIVLDGRHGGRGEISWRVVAFVLTLIAMAVWAWRMRSGDARSPDGAISLVTRSYLTLLRALAARGLEKGATETPLEFYRRIAPRLDGHAGTVAEVTALYHEARFSGRPGPSTALDRAVERAVAELAAEAPAAGAR